MNALVMGNLNVFKAGRIFEDIERILSESFHSPQNAVSHSRVINLLGYSLVRRHYPEGNDDNLNSATVNFYQWGQRSTYNLVMMKVLENSLNMFMYKYLRTDRELGYAASASFKRVGCIDGFMISVMGSKLAPHDVDAVIEQGLIEYRN